MNPAPRSVRAGRLLALALSTLVPFAARATIIAADSFDYDDGATLVGGDGGTGWAGAWQGGASDGTGTFATGIDRSANPLVFGDISGGGSAADFSGTANEVAVTRQLSGALTSTFYVAYLVRLDQGTLDSSNTFSLHFSDSTTNVDSFNFGLRANKKAPSLTDNFMVRTGTSAPEAGAAIGGLVSSGVDYYLVARLNSSGGTFSSADFWLNPAIGDLATPGATATGGTVSSIDQVLVRIAALTDDHVNLDSLIIATEWDDLFVPTEVVPEPGVASIMVLAGVAALLMRRRGRRG